MTSDGRIERDEQEGRILVAHGVARAKEPMFEGRY